MFQMLIRTKKAGDSYRGFFRTPVFINILYKLLYFDLYEKIDDSLTDCNVGSRKRRNIRDNLFVINAISNQSKQKNKEAFDVCVYDVRKCFDSLWLHECFNDLWDAGLQNDKLSILKKKTRVHTLQSKLQMDQQKA